MTTDEALAAIESRYPIMQFQIAVFRDVSGFRVSVRDHRKEYAQVAVGCGSDIPRAAEELLSRPPELIVGRNRMEQFLCDLFPRYKTWLQWALLANGAAPSLRGERMAMPRLSIRSMTLIYLFLSIFYIKGHMEARR